MLKKLSRRNAGRQMKDYLFYLLTMIIAVAMMFGFNTLVFSDMINQLPDIEVLPLMIVFASILVVLILTWLVSYMTGFMLKKRSKELGTYMVLGISNKRVSRLFFSENLLVGGVAFVLGIPVGLLVSQFLQIILLNIFGVFDEIRIGMNLKAMGLTAVYYLVVLLFSLRRSHKRIRNMKLREILYDNHTNETAIVKSNKLMAVIFIFSLFILAAGFWFFMTTPLGQGMDILAGVICLVAFLLGFFISIPSFIVLLIESRPAFKYKERVLYLFRLITSKLSSVSMTLGILSVIFTLAIASVSIAVVAHQVSVKDKEQGVLDLMIIHQGDASEISDYDTLLHSIVPIIDSHRYNIYMEQDRTIHKIWERLLHELVEESEMYISETVYSHHAFDNYIALSDYQKLCQMAGINERQLDEGHFLVHCAEGMAEAIREYFADNQTIEIDGAEFTFSGVWSEELDQSKPYGNGYDYVVVLPDEVAAKMAVSYSIFGAVVDGQVNMVTLLKMQALDPKLTVLDRYSMFSSDDYVSQIPNENLDYIAGKAQVHSETMQTYTMIIALLYLAIILEISGGAVLAAQILGDTKRAKTQYTVLNSIGMKKSGIQKLAVRYISVIYIVPVIPALLIGVAITGIIPRDLGIGTAHFTELVSGALKWQAFAIASLLFFLLYGLYYWMVNVIYKRSIEP